MRRESAEVSAAARRRLELLGRAVAEGGQGGRAGEPPEPVEMQVRTIVVPEPGRHARTSEAPWVARLLQDRLSTLRGRVGWSPAHLGVVAVLAATTLALVAWFALRAAPKEIASPIPEPPAIGSPLLVSATPTRPGSATEVVIDVAGKVRRPGVATLPAGSRVIDALRRAGGARNGVDLSTLNLARPLVDGEQILVGMPTAPGRAAGAVSGPAAGALVNLNSASADELEGLPGVGPVTAGKIVDWRTEHGAFTAVDELLDVAGIGTKTLAELAPHVTL